MKALKTLGQTLALSALAIGTTAGSVEARGQSTLKGEISLKGQPVSGSSITLWQTTAGQSAKRKLADAGACGLLPEQRF